jgi:hypothetical protein
MGNKPVLFSIIAILFLLVIGIGYYVGQQRTQVPEKPLAAMKEWKTYTNTYYGFSLRYPNGWINDNLCIDEPECKPQPVNDQWSTHYFHPNVAESSDSRNGILLVMPVKFRSSLMNVKEEYMKWNISDKKVEDVTINGYKGVTATGFLNGVKQKVITIKNDQYFFEFTATGEYTDTLDQMINTLKITK